LAAGSLIGQAATQLEVEASFADFARTVLPRKAVPHLTAPIAQIVLLTASDALQPVHLRAALNFALVALESETRKTVRALRALVADAAKFHRFAESLRSEVVAAVAGNAAVLVVALAVGDFAVAIREGEGPNALPAYVLHLVFAP
jgi:hypothetical protein